MKDHKLPIGIGSHVRTQPNARGISQTAIVGTIDEATTTASLVFLNPTCRPKPLERGPKFRVCPCLFDTDKDLEKNPLLLDENDVPLLLLLELHPFESVQKFDAAASPSLYKEYGDTLFRLRDVTCAVRYYEAALSLTSKFGIGGTSIVKAMDGRYPLVEVDCIDGDAIDVMFLSDSSEETVDRSRIQLTLLEGDDEERIQERILLNMARCFHILADNAIDSCWTDCDDGKQYHKAVVLSCTLALSCASFYTEREPAGPGSTLEKAHYLRAKAYLQLGHNCHAAADVRKCIQCNPRNKEANTLRQQIEHRKVQLKRTNKKLANEMCSWINSATATGDDSPKKTNGSVSKQQLDDDRANGYNDGTNADQNVSPMLPQYSLRLSNNRVFFAVAAMMAIVSYVWIRIFHLLPPLNEQTIIMKSNA